MNWDAMGAIGEIIGATAVIATLLYLAVQTRQTRMAVQDSSAIATAEAHSRSRLVLAQDAALSAVLAKANNGEALSDGEKIQLDNFCLDRFIAAVVGERTTTPDAPHLEVEYLIDFMTQNSGVIEEWHRLNHLIEGLAPNLTAEVNKWLSQRDG